MLRAWWYRAASLGLVMGILFVCVCAAWIHSDMKRPRRGRRHKASSAAAQKVLHSGKGSAGIHGRGAAPSGG